VPLCHQSHRWWQCRGGGCDERPATVVYVPPSRCRAVHARGGGADAFGTVTVRGFKRGYGPFAYAVTKLRLVG
jgi:hypothetical protein